MDVLEKRNQEIKKKLTEWTVEVLDILANGGLNEIDVKQFLDRVDATEAQRAIVKKAAHLLFEQHRDELREMYGWETTAEAQKRRIEVRDLTGQVWSPGTALGRDFRPWGS